MFKFGWMKKHDIGTQVSCGFKVSFKFYAGFSSLMVYSVTLVVYYLSRDESCNCIRLEDC